MIPSPADLNYFIEVALTENLSRAAERIGISQPSLTLAIQRLEQSVGALLLNRSKRGVSLTPAGRQLLSQARDLIDRWEQVRARTLSSELEIQGHFSLGCHPSVGLYSLPLFMPKLLEENPNLEIRLVHDISRRILEQVIQMKVDIGIVVNPSKHPDLVIKKLCSDQVTLWKCKGSSPLQNPQSDEAILICDPELLQTQHVIKLMKKKGLRFNRMISSSSLEVIAQLTASGLGVGLLPGRVAELARGSQLQRVKMAPAFEDEICLVYRMENKGVRALQEIAQSVLRSF